MTVHIAICDYGFGNLRNVEQALLAVGADARLTDDSATLAAADGIVLPGVGAFGPAAIALRERGLGDVLHGAVATGKPLLGVCLGFQILFDHGDESGGHAGLGLLRGTVSRLVPRPGRKVPHIGWNRLRYHRTDSLFSGIPEGTFMYFVHSYIARGDPDDVLATCDDQEPIAAACRRRNVMGTQFHPEKSGREGLQIYRNFCVATGSAG